MIYPTPIPLDNEPWYDYNKRTDEYFASHESFDDYKERINHARKSAYLPKATDKDLRAGYEARLERYGIKESDVVSNKF